MSLPLDRIAAGDGPDTVLLIHSSGMGATQWLRHIALLSTRHQVLAPQLLGYGKNPAWDPARETADADDLAALLALVDGLAGPIHLVGHSYGGTLGARLALARPTRFATLALFEPVLLGLLDPVKDADAFSELALPGLEGMTAGSAQWTEAFVDYWGGVGAFQKMSPSIRTQFVAAGPKVSAEVVGIAADQAPAESYRVLTLPTLVAYGEKTTLAGKAMSQTLAKAIPQAQLRVFAGVGHMAPVLRASETVAMLEMLFVRNPAAAKP